jgi:hypothetical protein
MPCVEADGNTSLGCAYVMNKGYVRPSATLFTITFLKLLHLDSQFSDDGPIIHNLSISTLRPIEISLSIVLAHVTIIP